MKNITFCFFLFFLSYSNLPSYITLNNYTERAAFKVNSTTNRTVASAGFSKVAFNKSPIAYLNNIGAPNGTISVNPLRIYDNNVAGAASGINRTITVKNTGQAILSVTSINVSGTNNPFFSLSGLPALPKNINPGDSISFFVTFIPPTTGIKIASVTIHSSDPLSPVTSIPLRGLGTNGLGGSNEPSLQLLMNLLEVDVNVGDDNISTTVINSKTALQKSLLLGDEVRIQKFEKAGVGNVTITPLAVFGPTDSSTVVGMGWYKSGNVSANSELFTVSNNPLSNGQNVNVNFTGTLSFDPATDTFGFYTRWPFFNNRHVYSEDNLNTFTGSIPHHVRVYPYKKNGVLIADSYLIAFEENTSGFDYQDMVFLVSNVKKAPSNALLFVENLDKFPSNDRFVFSRVQIPWSRDSINYNSNHDSVKVRIHNNGLNALIITNLILSDTTWKISKLNTTQYVAGTGLPKTVSSGTYLDVTLKFLAADQASTIKILHETLTILSNDDNSPIKTVYLTGLWQKSGEGTHEPHAQDIINAFGFTTQVGFDETDPDLGDSTKLKGDEIKPSFFLLADSSLPASIRQISAYHGCCTSTEKIMWYPKNSPSTLNTVFTHIEQDAQTLLPRRIAPSTSASGVISPTASFGFKVGYTDVTDASKNPGKAIGIRVWKAINDSGLIIPNSYILSNDYLGTTSTNFDYNDNTYFISNIKPETGSVFYSSLSSTPSAVDFGEKILQTSNSLQLSIKNLGKMYANGTSDPIIKISAIKISGENSLEFSAALPADTTLNPQQTAAITVGFHPISQGLKIADLLIYYNNSLSPLRIPLYGISKAGDSIAVVNYRIKSGSSTPIVVNGKTWSADTPYAFDNLEPYTNPNLSQIAATDDDALYLTEQSSNGDKKPFRYQLPLTNGNYIVRLHFSEIYWGAPGGGIGGAGSRVQSVKLENQLQIINFDISQEVGVASALIKNIPVTVSDGMLNIDFLATINRPSVSAVEVYSFTSSGPLAANDFNLKGSLIDHGVKLNWINTNETATNYYEVERSANNLNFTALGKVPAINAAEYNFFDANPHAANNFYRVKKVNADGTFAYSGIIRINISKVITMELFPNPGASKISLQFTGIISNPNALLTIKSLSGAKVKSMPFILSNQKTDIDISSLGAGMYILHLTGSNLNFSSKFLKK